MFGLIFLVFRPRFARPPYHIRYGRNSFFVCIPNVIQLFAADTEKSED